MKLLACLLILFTNSLLAQVKETIKISGAEYADFIAKNQYKYPGYTRAKIFLKNGEVASARINYNNFFHTIKFINGADTLEVANQEDINYIAIDTDSIFCDKDYYQWIASSAVARLAVRHVYKEGERVLVGAFGTSSPAKSIDGVTKLLTDVSTKDLSPNEEIMIIKETTYYISLINGKGNFMPVTKSNISKLFPKKNTEEYIKTNKLNLNKEEDLIDLLIYISK